MARRHQMANLAKGWRFNSISFAAKRAERGLDYSKLLDMHEAHGLTYRQIAEHFGVSRGTIAGLINRARKTEKAGVSA